MKIVITGGRGRVGAAVSQHALAAGHEIVVVDHAPLPQEQHSRRVDLVADTTSYEQMHAVLFGADAVVHLAGHPNADRATEWDVHNENIISSYNVLMAAAANRVRRVALASSVNYYGLLYSSRVQLDYLPLDEEHPTYNDDAYSLSKVESEEQAKSIARRHPEMGIAALRLHWVVESKPQADGEPEKSAKQLWGYVLADAAARAFLLAVTADLTGFEAFLIVADDTVAAASSRELSTRFYPDVPVRRQIRGEGGFFDCSKAERMLGWTHSTQRDPRAEPACLA